MRLLIVAATQFELKPLLDFLATADHNWQPKEAAEISDNSLSVSLFSVYTNGETELHIGITGVGLTATAFYLGACLARQGGYHLVVHAGIAGTWDAEIGLGTVVEVAEECFADLGAETATGDFIPLDQLFAGSAIYPNHLINPQPYFADLPKVKAMSVNRVSGNGTSIAALKLRLPEVQIESMEGAALFYACLKFGQPFAALRAISNRIEPRDRSNWAIAEAIQQLNHRLIAFLQGFDEYSVNEKR